MIRKMKVTNKKSKTYLTYFVLYIYLKGSKACAFKSELMSEEEIDQFYAELNNSDRVMEFGTLERGMFYFNKDEFKCSKTKKVKILKKN